MGETATGLWGWIVEKIIPPLAIAGAGAILTVALTVRDNSHALADLRRVADRLATALDREIAGRTADCATVRTQLGAVDARLGVIETRHEAHVSESNEWKDRIRRCEATNGSSRRCTEMEERLRRLEDYRAVDEHRMSTIEARIGAAKP